MVAPNDLRSPPKGTCCLPPGADRYGGGFSSSLGSGQRASHLAFGEGAPGALWVLDQSQEGAVGVDEGADA